MRRIRAIALSLLIAIPLVGSVSIAGLRIARAQGVSGSCIYNATVAIVAGYPDLPACDSSRNLKITGSVTCTAGCSTATQAAPSYTRIEDGTSTMLAVVTANSLQTTICSWILTGMCADVGTSFWGSGDNPSQSALVTVSEPITWDPIAGATARYLGVRGETAVNTGGTAQTKITAGTTCTSVKTAGVTLHAAWASDSTETVTTTFYNEGASPTCAAADAIWSGVLSPTTQIPSALLFSAGLAVKQSAAPLTNDYLQTT